MHVFLNILFFLFFQPCLKTLETLNLGKNNLENRGIHTLKESLMINRSLLQLGLAATGITCEGRVRNIAFLPLCHILSIDLLFSGIHFCFTLWLSLCFLPIVPGAVTLAEILAESPQIQRLDVRQNQVLAGGLMALSLALKINRSLIRLDLDEHLKEEKVRCLILIISVCRKSILHTDESWIRIENNREFLKL